MNLIDTHTHRLNHDAIVNRAPGEPRPLGYSYSVGVHPWQAMTFDRDSLMADASARDVVAIGECGLDALRGPASDIQQDLFIDHVNISEQVGKPLIIHCVKAIDQIINIKRRMKPTQPWIIHSFRGKPSMALQLLRHGLWLSLGPRFNPATAAVIPDRSLLVETDDSDETIAGVIDSVAQARGCAPARLTEIAAANLHDIIALTH